MRVDGVGPPAADIGTSHRPCGSRPYGRRTEPRSCSWRPKPVRARSSPCIPTARPHRSLSPMNPGIEQALDPDWSPRGDGLAFVVTNACIHLPGSDVIGPDGAVVAASNPTGCAPPSDTCPWLENRLPVVSPDGTQVAYWRVGGPGRMAPAWSVLTGAQTGSSRRAPAFSVSIGARSRRPHRRVCATARAPVVAVRVLTFSLVRPATT